MKPFHHADAKTLDEAVQWMTAYGDKAKFLAGGTDLLGLLKQKVPLNYPEMLINLKTIKGLDQIQIDEQGLTVGANVKLAEMVHSPVIKNAYPILAAAAESVAMPQIRNMGTLGGNLAQETRCWYFRYPRDIGGMVMCRRKGEGPCLAVKGDNRYHAIFGAKKCFAVCPSDMAVALAALDGEIRIVGPKGERSVSAMDFNHPLGNALSTGEIITEIRIPKPGVNSRQAFFKHRVRNTIDFAIVSVGIAATIKENTCAESKIFLGAVAPGPWRALEAEQVLEGKDINEQTIQQASDAAVTGAVPLSRNGYKVEIVKAMVKKALVHVNNGL
jgi:xanthine dehydrogenase YagS FAD-binding subunit